MRLKYDQNISISLFIVLLICTAIPCLSAQEKKQGVETSINISEIPEETLSILNQFWNDEKKADFYREFDGQSVSYEAKFKLDIELLINFDEIPENTGNTIKSYLNDQYTKFRITRVQRQYSSNEDDLTIRYDWKLKLRIKKSWELLNFCLTKMHNLSGNVKL